jgi:DNA-binding transcriptional ArsR family regulator
LDGERNVGELVAARGMQQGRVSSHLACLRWCGFISTRREGKYVYYRIGDARVGELLHLAHRLLADHGGALVTCACCVTMGQGENDDGEPTACG